MFPLKHGNKRQWSQVLARIKCNIINISLSRGRTGGNSVCSLDIVKWHFKGWKEGELSLLRNWATAHQELLLCKMHWNEHIATCAVSVMISHLISRPWVQSCNRRKPCRKSQGQLKQGEEPVVLQVLLTPTTIISDHAGGDEDEGRQVPPTLC